MSMPDLPDEHPCEKLPDREGYFRFLRFFQPQALLHFLIDQLK